MPIVLPAVMYASRPRRWPSSATPESVSEVPIMPAPGTNCAATGDDGSVRVTMCMAYLGSPGHWVVLNAFRRGPFGDQGGLGGLDHGRSAADQDLPIAPAAVFGHHVGQPAGLAHVQATWRRGVGILGGPRGVAAVLRDRRDGQPRSVLRDLPQGRQVVELAEVARAEEKVYARIFRVTAEVHEQCPQRCETGATGNHQHVPAVPVDPQAAVRTRQPPAVAGLGFVDDGGADQAAGNHADMELDSAARVGRNRGTQIAPAARALRDVDIDVLAWVVLHRAVQLQPNDGEIARNPTVLDDRAVPPGGPL